VDAFHKYLGRHHPKTGICDQCGAAAKTDYALIHGREYSRNRNDYRELCRKCHAGYDLGGALAASAKLTEAAVGEISRRYAAGESQRSLSREYGVTQSAISMALAGKTWSQHARD
jgi:hypothetical protein